MADPSLLRTLGDVSLPLKAADLVAGTFPDQALTTMLELFQAAINAELAQAWTTAVAGSPMAGSTPVETTLPLEPSSQSMTQWKAGFPLLALHRSGTAEFDERTLEIDQRTQEWELHYILAALQVDDMHKFRSVVSSIVPTIVSQTIKRQGHPAYQSGAVQFDESRGGLAIVRLTNTTSGMARFVDDEAGPPYLACTMTLTTVELDGDVDGAFTDLEGVSFEFGVGGGEGIVPGLIYADA